MLEEVILEVKDLFISHRVEPILQHLKEKRTQVKEEMAKEKK